MAIRIIAPLVLGFVLVGSVGEATAHRGSGRVELAHRGSGRVEPMLVAYGQNPDMTGHPGTPGETQGSATRSSGKGRSNKDATGKRNAQRYCNYNNCRVIACFDTGLGTTRCLIHFEGDPEIETYTIECGNDRGDSCW